jgi:hypothetical protein
MEDQPMPEFSQAPDKSRGPELFPGAALWANPLGAWGEAGSTYLKACAAWQQELSRFFGARIEADIAAQRSLAECRNLADAAKLQQEWAATAVNDYVNEAGRMIEILSRCAQPAAATAEPTARDSFRARAAS